MTPLYQSILFALPLVCGAAALIGGGIFRRASGFRIALVILSLVAGISACGLIIFGFLQVPKVEIYQSGFRAPISTTGNERNQAGFWSAIPWALPRTSGPALEVCGIGGANEKRRLLARQTQRSLGQLLVDFPKGPGRRLALDDFTIPIEGSTELTWKGDKIEISWREKDGEEEVRIKYPDGSTDSVGSASLRYPKAWQIRDPNQADINRSGLFVTRLSKDRGKKAHILALNPQLEGSEGGGRGDFQVNGEVFSPNLEFASGPNPNFLRVTRWNTVMKRFQTHVFELSFMRNQVEGKILDISRFDRLRLDLDFLQREDTVHFLVSDWLYQNPYPSPAQLGAGHVGSFGLTGNFVPDVESRISKYDASGRPGIQVALTFDDGPVEGNTPKVLDILRQHQVPATFFVLGRNAKKHPSLMKRIRQEGHEIGNHSWDHSSAWYLRTDFQVGETNSIIGETGSKPRFFRPPYGAMGKSRTWLAGRLASRYSLETIFWSVDPQEYRRSATDDGVVKAVVRDIHDGAVVLMHDINSRTVRTLPEIIKSLQRQKVEFLTLSELRDVSKGENIPSRRAVRLPSVANLPSYLTLPYLPADATGSGTRIEVNNGKLKFLSQDDIRPQGNNNGVWELPTGPGGAVFLQTKRLGPSILMLLLALGISFVVTLVVLKLGNLQGAFVVAILGLVLTRFVLALSADHVFPDDVHLWNPPNFEYTQNWLVENTTTLALLAPIIICALILPGTIIGIQDTLANRLITQFRLRRWFGFLLGLFILFASLIVVWLAGGGERIGPIQKSAFYLPLIILGTSWIIGIGGVRSAQSRTPTERCWPVFAALFFLLACIHGMFAVFRQDLGAILVLLPATWLFLCYASSQANWLWRGALWVLASLAVVWGIRFITSFLSAIHHDDYPLDIIPDISAIKIAIAIIFVIVTLLILRAMPNQMARRIGLPILGISILAATGIQFLPINEIARKIVVPKSESQKENLYSQYLRFRSVDRDFLNTEGTQRAMEISEEQKIVDVYGMGGWFGDGFGTLPFDRSRYNFLNDYVVSTFIRGQFGLMGVLALASWQLALVFFSTRLNLARTSRSSQVSARLAFWEAAGKLSCWVIGFISIYMIVSNLGFPWAPLTGKNVFLLGLNSSSDVLEGSILIFIICAAAMCVHKERRTS